MATAVILPKVDMVMETGTFVEWLVNEGETVRKDQPLFVITTDKAAIEVEAPANGTLAGLRAEPGDEIPVSETIAYILGPGEALPATVQNGQGRAPAAAAPENEASRAAEATSRVKDVAVVSAVLGKVRATPLARRMAAEMDIDLAALQGRGPRGRVHQADVLAAARTQTSPPAVAPEIAPYGMAALALSLPLPDARQKGVVPLVGPRKIIAQRLAYSAAVAPHISLSISVDMSEAVRLRDRVRAKVEQATGQHLSYTAILLRAVAATLPRHPYLNASLAGEEIILWDDVHIGVATSLEDYLIVPVVRQAQDKNLEQIVVALADLLARARNRRLAPSEMSGSTFSVSNLGMFGIESFTAIINPPEAAILSVGKITDTCVRVDGEMTMRPLMNLTINADHRIVDGAAAANYLAELKNCLENPYLLI